MNDSKSKLSSWEAQTAKNTKSLGFWTIAWVLSLALAVFGPMFIWDSQVLLITGLSFSTLAIADLISLDADISHMVILMSITYAIGLTIGRRKYQ